MPEDVRRFDALYEKVFARQAPERAAAAVSGPESATAAPSLGDAPRDPASPLAVPGTRRLRMGPFANAKGSGPAVPSSSLGAVETGTPFRSRLSAQRSSAEPASAAPPAPPPVDILTRIATVARFEFDAAVLVRLGTQLAEEFRHIRTNLQTLHHRKGLKLFALTSCHHAEGKTTTALNLARMFARQSRMRVCLVDCDLRRPSLKRFLRDHEIKVGLEHVLQGQAELEDAMVHSTGDNLTMVLAHRGSSKAAELLESERFTQVLERLRQQFDFVIIDTPPLLSTTDPAVIGKKVDGIAILVQAHLTQRESVQHAKRLLEQVGVNILGVILNKVRDYLPKSKYLYRYHYYRDYHYYRYGYNYAYGPSEESEKSEQPEGPAPEK